MQAFNGQPMFSLPKTSADQMRYVMNMLLRWDSETICWVGRGEGTAAALLASVLLTPSY